MNLPNHITSKIFYSPDGCWYWIGATNSRNRGQIYFENKIALAHRAVFTILKGIIPTGLLVCHTCDNGLCVNPDHMFLGTNKDNTVDMVNKGRHYQTLKRFCKYGHEFTPENTGKHSNGSRRCKKCTNEQCRQYYIKKQKLTQ